MDFGFFANGPKGATAAAATEAAAAEAAELAVVTAYATPATAVDSRSMSPAARLECLLTLSAPAVVAPIAVAGIVLHCGRQQHTEIKGKAQTNRDVREGRQQQSSLTHENSTDTCARLQATVFTALLFAQFSDLELAAGTVGSVLISRLQRCKLFVLDPKTA